MSRQAHEKEFHDGRNGKPKPYEVGVQIPCGVYPEVPQKDAVRGVAAALGRDETVIRDYIRNQEQEDKRLDQMNLWR